MSAALQEAFYSAGKTLTAASRRVASHLSDQQLWCFGRDIVKPRRNRLLERGFVRYKPPGETRGPSNYRLDADDFHIGLWGFGIWYGTKDLGSLFLRRTGFVPVWSNREALPQNVWRHHELPKFRVPRAPEEISHAAELLEGLCLWLADYEERISQDLGRDYRRVIVAEWGQLRKPMIDADGIVNHWQAIANADWNVLSTPRQEAA